MKPVKLGIIGCGVISNAAHLPDATKSPLVELVAVADLIEERVKAAAEKYNVPTAYKSGDELLKDSNIEAVVLAMPVRERTPLAFKALEKGKHVLLEKPVARNVGEVERMMALRGDRVVAVCSPRYAFSAHAEAAAECVASGVLGKIRVARVRAILGVSEPPKNDPPPWRQNMEMNGGGILVNWSCYDLDYLMSITHWRLRPRLVTARWWPIAPKLSANVAAGSDADSHYIAFIMCEGGIVLSMERAEFASTVTDQAWEIIGTEATLRLPMRPQKVKPNAVMLDRADPGKGVVSEPIWEEGQSDKPGGNVQAFGKGLSEKGKTGASAPVMEDFVLAIREGREPKTNLERALVMQKITDAIYASAERGEAIPIS